MHFIITDIAVNGVNRVYLNASEMGTIIRQGDEF